MRCFHCCGGKQFGPSSSNVYRLLLTCAGLKVWFSFLKAVFRLNPVLKQAAIFGAKTVSFMN